VIFLLILNTSKTVFAQVDREFWFAAPEISYEFIPPSPITYQGLDRPIKLYITTAEGLANFTIDQPANPSFIPISSIAEMDSTTEVDLTSFIDQIENKPANAILNYGLRIRSDEPVTVYYEVQSLYNQETFVLKGRNALGYEFIIPAQTHFINYNWCDPPARNSFIVLATEDSTIVTIIPSNDIEGQIAYDTVAIQLNRGQTWCARATGGDSTQHLAGSFVFANKPIAVTVSDDEVKATGTSNNRVDMAGDQLIPKHLCGKEYIPGFRARTAPIGSRIMLFAFQDSTWISLNGGSQIMINRGDFHETVYFAPDSLGICYLTSTKPVLAYHFRSSDNQASANIIPPSSPCNGSRRINMTKTPPALPFIGFQLTLVTQNGNQNNFTVLGFPPINLSTAYWDTVPGTNNEWIWTDIGIGGTIGYFVNYTFINSSGRFLLSSATNLEDYFSKGNYYSEITTDRLTF
jgi:hypothetical protein